MEALTDRLGGGIYPPPEIQPTPGEVAARMDRILALEIAPAWVRHPMPWD